MRPVMIAASFLLVASIVSIALGEESGCYDPEARSVSFETLVKDLRANGVSSTSQMLDFFARSPKYRGFLSHPVLLKSSGAIHGDMGPEGDHEVSPKFPRVELELGNITLHFTGDPTRPGHQLVELMEFDPRTGRSHARLINFHLFGQDSMVLRDPDQELRGSMMELYVRTAGKGVAPCVACHVRRRDEQGHYYSAMVWGPRSGQIRPYGNFEDRIRKGTKEYRDFQSFLQTMKDPVTGELYRKIGLSWETAPNGDLVLPGRNNLTFTEKIYEKARYQSAQDFLRSPNYREYQYAIMGAFMGCRDIPSFLPAGPREQREKEERNALGTALDPHRGIIESVQEYIRSLNGQLEDLSRENMRFSAGLQVINDTSLQEIVAPIPNLDPILMENHRRLGRDFVSDEYTSAIAGLHFLFYRRGNAYHFASETPIGFPPQNYFDRGFRIDGGLAGLRKIVSCHLGPDFISRNPDLNAFREGIVDPDHLSVPKAQYCEQLKQKSLSAFSALAPHGAGAGVPAHSQVR